MSQNICYCYCENYDTTAAIMGQNDMVKMARDQNDRRHKMNMTKTFDSKLALDSY